VATTKTLENAELGPTDADLASATQRAERAIRQLQVRLTGETPEPVSSTWGTKRQATATELSGQTLGREPVPDLTTDELERQLQQYFERTAGTGGVNQSVLEALRSRVVEAVVERLLKEWQNPGTEPATPLQREVMERLIERVMERLGTGSGE